MLLACCALAAAAPLRAQQSGRWALSLDNDALTGATEDRDYTAGFGAALTGPEAAQYAAPNNRALEWLDRRLGAARLHRSPRAVFQQDGVQLGLLMFTPDDIANPDPILTDRPYANIAFVEHSHYGLDADRRVMHESTFAVGVIGLPLVAELHKGVHAAIGDQEPRGYRHQISNGGELTARYAFARHALLATGGARRGYDAYYTLGASAGYLTEAVASIGLRWGALDSPWWTGMHAGSYGIAGAASRFDAYPGNDSYLWAGVTLRARFYNVFLQGQFRNSDLTFDSDDLERFVLEAGAGYTRDLGPVQLTYALRWQTPELEAGPAARPVTWAGITISGSRRRER